LTGSGGRGIALAKSFEGTTMSAVRSPVRLVAACVLLAGCAASRYGEVVVSAVQGSRLEKVSLPRDPANPPSRDATLAYWKGLKGFHSSDNTDQIRRDFADYADRLRKLPVIGVDPELVEKVLVAAREMKNVADISKFMAEECSPFFTPAPEAVKEEFLHSASLLTQAIEAVNALRPVLSQRYGVEFPAE
jgi:hypothetical protein